MDVERTVDTCVRDFSRLTSLDRSSIGAVLPDVLWDGHHAKALANPSLRVVDNIGIVANSPSCVRQCPWAR